MLTVDIIGLSIITIFLLFIFKKRKKLMSDYMLIITIILIGGIFLSDFWIRHGINRVNLIFEKSIGFYLLPAFLAYGMLLISEDNKIKKEWWWFLSFAIGFTIYIIIDIYILNSFGSEGLSNRYKSPPLLYLIFFRGSNVFVFFALLWFLKKLKHYRRKIKNNFSDIETINFNWLTIFTWLYLINNGLIFVISIVFSFAHIGNLNLLYLVVYVSILFSLFYLCYKGIKHYSFVEFMSSSNLNILEGQQFLVAPETNISPKYKSSSLSDSEMESIMKKIEKLFELEKIFLEPRLKIQDLATNLDITTHKVSQTINAKTSETFYDYVNHYRVEYFKKLLANPENRKFTILALGIESGFNSKASLNRIFKQYVKMSPKEFQLNQNNV